MHLVEDQFALNTHLFDVFETLKDAHRVPTTFRALQRRGEANLHRVRPPLRGRTQHFGSDTAMITRY